MAQGHCGGVRQDPLEPILSSDPVSELGEVSNMANGRRMAAQKGEGKMGGMISLAALVAFGYAVWNVAPVYYADFNLGDKMVEVCRLHPAQAAEDKIRDVLMRTVREEGLAEYVTRADFKIQTRENARRITLEYERKAKVLPGWVRTFKFSKDVDQPFF
jgi:hypothetical protein